MTKQPKARTPGRKAFSGTSSPAAFGAFSSPASNLSYISKPPDLAAISDASVVVALKNLLKKDSTTKAKGLDELVAYAQSHPYDQDGGAEEALLEAWVQLYPRISIDGSRRVRELSHTLQLELMKSARKRMEKHIPRIVGAWLAGTFDRDRVVSRAATGGLSSFLKTDERSIQFWRKCQVQILEYATEAIRETPDSLSDERSTTKEDAEAKYYRVVGGSLSLVLGLLQKGDTEKSREQFEQFLAADATWALVAAQDSFVRRTVYQLVQVCLHHHPDLLSPQLPRIGRALVSDAPKSTQIGSAADLVKVLTNLTTRHPEVWGTKKQPLSRIQSLVEKGSQGGSYIFWQELPRLIAVLPLDNVSFETATAFMKAMRLGISRREEPRTHLPHSWTCYIDILQLLLRSMTPGDAPTDFIKANFYPLTDQYLFPTADKSPWTGGAQLKILAKAWTNLASHSDASIRQSVIVEWQRLGDALVSRMANSLPEVSTDFQKSQQSVADEGSRWFDLVGSLLGHIKGTDGPEGAPSSSLTSTVLSTSNKILQGALELLAKRNFKPFGAASILQSALMKVPDLFRDSNDETLSKIFLPDRPEELKTLLESPSAPFLLSSVTLIGAIPEQRSRYEAIWNALIQVLIPSDSLESDNATTVLISAEVAKPLAQKDESLQTFLTTRCLQTAQGDNEAWKLFESALTFGAIEDSRVRSLAAEIVRLLGSPGQPQEPVLRGLETIVHKSPAIVSHASDLHVELVAKLLSLTEISSQSVADQAASLRKLLDKHVDGQPPLVGIIQEHLDSASVDSLDIDTLVQQATSVFASGSVPLETLLPNTNIWMEELSLFLQDLPSPALSVANTLSGAYFLVKKTSSPKGSKPRRDRQGRSVPARMAIYTARILATGFDLSSLPQELKVELLYLLYLVVEVASDQLTLMEDGKLWANPLDETTATEMEDFITSARKVLQAIVTDANGWGDGIAGGDSVVDGLIGIMFQQTKDLSAMALYSAKALSDLLQDMSETHGFPPAIEQRFINPDVLRATPTTIFGAIALITGFGEALASSKTVNRLCNGLISDITGAFPTSEKTLLVMVLLNACISVYEIGELPVENRRQVFAVRQITTWTDTPDEMDSRLAAEACKALQRLFPNIKTIYGPYWEQAIEYCIQLWDGAAQDPLEARLPYIHASLKLLSTLESMAGANDDLDDALYAHAERKSLALVEVLKLPQDLINQPSEIVDALLCRRIARIPLEHVKDTGDLYGLVASESREIQAAAFGLLDRALPAAQEQLSIDVLLEKRDAHLPDELISLLLEPPTLESYPDDILAQFPTPVRSYLLTWLLIFDTYKAAAFKVRNDYTADLKSSNSVEPLMEFMFDVLGHSAAHALNLDREGFTADYIRAYNVNVADSEPAERNMHWLLVHLFYLTLKYVPGLFKAWFIDCKSKRTKIAVEDWMTKYFSPLIIDETLAEVSDWASKQEPPDQDDKELLVKVSRGTGEVVAGYEVDELQASIAIRIPAAYPLNLVNVIGINRVAVSEKRWQSWLTVTQGVITFSNGNIIDGLIAFRRNVVGALKGQIECAICYSIISADKKMPDKKCSTCNNLFHRTCLYKWFQTSNQNTCPLCRNPIDYLGADTASRRGGGAAH